MSNPTTRHQAIEVSLLLLKKQKNLLAAPFEGAFIVGETVVQVEIVVPDVGGAAVDAGCLEDRVEPARGVDLDVPAVLLEEVGGGDAYHGGKGRDDSSDETHYAREGSDPEPSRGLVLVVF